MKWYTDYLSAYEKPYSELPPPLTNRVKKRIRELKHPNPLVSVVAIAHNEGNRIFSCLWSICENNCHFPIEIIVVNNHSTDNTESILKKLGVTYYNEEQKGPGFARPPLTPMPITKIKIGSSIMLRTAPISTEYIAIAGRP